MLKVLKFTVKHKGIYYGPNQEGGEIIEGLSEEEEKALLLSQPDVFERVDLVNPVIKKSADEIIEENLSADEEVEIKFDPDECIQQQPQRKKK